MCRRCRGRCSGRCVTGGFEEYGSCVLRWWRCSVSPYSISTIRFGGPAEFREGTMLLCGVPAGLVVMTNILSDVVARVLNCRSCVDTVSTEGSRDNEELLFELGGAAVFGMWTARLCHVQAAQDQWMSRVPTTAAILGLRRLLDRVVRKEHACRQISSTTGRLDQSLSCSALRSSKASS